MPDTQKLVAEAERHATVSNISADRRLRKTMGWLSLVLAIGISTLTPTVYLAAGLSYEQERVQIENRRVAGEIEELVASNPDLWTFLVERINFVFARSLRRNAEHPERSVIHIGLHLPDGSHVHDLGDGHSIFSIHAESPVRFGTFPKQ